MRIHSVLLSMLLVAGVATVAASSPRDSRISRAAERVSRRLYSDDVIQAYSFDVFDANDRFTGTLYSDESTGGADLYLTAANGSDVATLVGASEGETYYLASDKYGNVRIAMGVDAYGRAYFDMYDSRGRRKFHKTTK